MVNNEVSFHERFVLFNFLDKLFLIIHLNMYLQMSEVKFVAVEMCLKELFEDFQKTDPKNLVCLANDLRPQSFFHNAHMHQQ